MGVGGGGRAGGGTHPLLARITSLIPPASSSPTLNTCGIDKPQYVLGQAGTLPADPTASAVVPCEPERGANARSLPASACSACQPVLSGAPLPPLVSPLCACVPSTCVSSQPSAPATDGGKASAAPRMLDRGTGQNRVAGKGVGGEGGWGGVEGAVDGKGCLGPDDTAPARRVGAGRWVSGPVREPSSLPRVLLHLFDGGGGEDSAAVREAGERGWAVEGFDIRRSSGQDLSRDSEFQRLMRRARAGEFGAVIAGIPCHTFAILLLLDDGGPSQVRERGEHVEGLPPERLTRRRRWRLAESNMLIRRSCDIIRAVWKGGGDYVIENPIDRGDPSLPFVFQDARHVSLFSHPAILDLQRETGGRGSPLPAVCVGGTLPEVDDTPLLGSSSWTSARPARTTMHPRSTRAPGAGQGLSGQVAQCDGGRVPRRGGQTAGNGRVP